MNKSQKGNTIHMINNAHVITLATNKGGIAKTTLSFVLACGLARKGYRVLALDMCGQCNFTYLTDYVKDGTTASISDLLTDPNCTNAYADSMQNFKVIPGDSKLADVNISNYKTKGYSDLRSKLTSIMKQNEFDYVIIDTPAILEWPSLQALLCADSVIVPIEAGVFGLQATQVIIDYINEAKQINTDLELAGFVLTRYKGRATFTKDMQQGFASMADSLGVQIFGTMRESIRMAESQFMKKSIFDYTKDDITKDCSLIVDRIEQYTKQRKKV